MDKIQINDKLWTLIHTIEDLQIEIYSKNISRLSLEYLSEDIDIIKQDILNLFKKT